MFNIYTKGKNANDVWIKTMKSLVINMLIQER